MPGPGHLDRLLAWEMHNTPTTAGYHSTAHCKHLGSRPPLRQGSLRQLLAGIRHDSFSTDFGFGCLCFFGNPCSSFTIFFVTAGAGIPPAARAEQETS